MIERDFKEVIRFLNGLSKDELIELFAAKVTMGDLGIKEYCFKILDELSINELFAIMNKVMDKKAFKVGDEVELKGGFRGYVTRVSEDKLWVVFKHGGCTYNIKECFKKTGKKSIELIRLLEEWKDDESKRRWFAEGNY